MDSPQAQDRKTSIITGASSGIGRSIAERLGARGDYVVLVGRTTSALDESVAKINAAGGIAVAVTADVRDPASIGSVVDDAVAATGRLDVFVNNAGVGHQTPIIEADPEEWRAMLDTNVFALLVGSQAAIRAMRETSSRGHVVNISSIAAQGPDSGVYGATKHAVNVISKTLRGELLDDPIQVVTIMPGLIATNFGRNLDPTILQGLVAMSGLEFEVTPGARIPDEVLDAAQGVLNEYMCHPDDVADAVIYAVSQPAHVHIAEVVVRPNKDLEIF